MLVKGEYRFFLPFDMGLVEGVMTEAIQFSIGDAQISIHPLTFADEHGLPDPPQMEFPEENSLEYMKRVIGHTDGKKVLSTNVVDIDVTIDVEGFEQSSDKSKNMDKLDPIFEPVAKNALSTFLEICRFRTENARIEYKGVIGRYSRDYYVDSDRIGTGINFSVHSPGPYIDADKLRKISDDLVSDYEIPLAKNLLLDARSLLRERTRRLAVINAVTALDVSISDFVNEHLCSIKVDKDHYIRFIYDAWAYANLPRRLEGAIKLLPSDICEEVKHKGLQKKCLAANELRNKVIHRGEDIPEGHAEMVRDYVNAIGEMIGYFTGNTCID